jgi:uncharacterized membrane-anchored protein YitT (DUF2179 family)
MQNKELKEEIKGFFFMLIGCVAYAISTSFLLAPNSIVSGGMAGLAVLFHLFNENIPVGLMTVALNIPIFLCGLKMQGWKFIVRSLITVATLGVITDLLAPIGAMTTDGVLASLYGGICQGIGIGLFVRYEFSSGGTELLARLFKRWFKILKIPVWVGVLDGIIVILGSIFTQNPNNMLYALIVIFVSTKVSEMILVGVEKSKLCIIITDKGQDISDELLRNSPRGVTMLDGEGMYTKRNRDVILTCVKNNQLTQLKQIVKGIDEHAFIIINDSVEVRGQGFQSLLDNN